MQMDTQSTKTNEKVPTCQELVSFLESGRITDEQLVLLLDNASYLQIFLNKRRDTLNLSSLYDLVNNNKTLIEDRALLMFNEALILTDSFFEPVKKYTSQLQIPPCESQSNEYINIKSAVSKNLFSHDAFTKNTYNKKLSSRVYSSSVSSKEILIETPFEQNFIFSKLNFADEVYSKYTSGLSERLKHIDNAMIAGGSLLISLFFHSEEQFPEADIDIFVWGETCQSRVDTINKLIKEITLITPSDIIVTMCNKVITIFRRGKYLPIQIIDSGNSTPEKIVDEFDLAASKIFYHKGEFKVSAQFIKAINSKCCRASRCFTYRLAKYMKRGFNIVTDKNQKIKDVFAENYDWDNLYTKPEVISSFNKYFRVKNETPERVEFLAKTLYHKNYKLLSGPLSITDISSRDETTALDNYFETDDTITVANSVEEFIGMLCDFESNHTIKMENHVKEYMRMLSVFDGSSSLKFARDASMKKIYLKVTKLSGVLRRGRDRVTGNRTQFLTDAKFEGSDNKLFADKLKTAMIQHSSADFNSTFSITESKKIDEILQEYPDNSKICLENAILSVYKYGCTIYFKVKSIQ